MNIDLCTRLRVMARDSTLPLLVPLLLLFVPHALVAADKPSLGKLEQLVGVWQVTIKEPAADGWRTAAPVFVEATAILRGQYVALEGLFAMPGHERPLGMLLLFSQDPFQSVVRVSVLDDLVGLLDGYAGGWQGNRLVLTNLACDTPWQGKVHGRLTVVLDGPDRFEIRSDTSTDRGATWKQGLIASFQRH